MSHRPFRLVVIAAALLAALLAPVPSAASRGHDHHPPSRTVDVQVLAINDFHGNLEPPGGTFFGAPAGGAAYLATVIRQLSEGVRDNVVVSAGDLIGASPLLSALFHDEPTIEAMNQIGLAAQRGRATTSSTRASTSSCACRRGGCHPVDGCQDGDGFAGADFDFLAANVFDQDTGRTLFPPYSIRNLHGTRVAFIGMTLEGTPSIVTPSGVAGLEFRDEADTVNALVPRAPATAGWSRSWCCSTRAASPTGGVNGCPGVSGPIVDIVARLDDEIDAVVSGHTHQRVQLRVPTPPATRSW